MLKTFAALGLTAALVFAPLVALAEDATPTPTPTETMKPMKHHMKHHMKHMMHKKKMKKEKMMAPKTDATPAPDAPK